MAIYERFVDIAVTDKNYAWLYIESADAVSCNIFTGNLSDNQMSNMKT